MKKVSFSKNKKLLILIFIFGFLIMNVNAQNKADEIKVESKLNEATVFLRGAQLSRTADVSIPAGTREIVITNLPVGIDQNSIQVKGKGNFMILSVNYRQDYLADAAVDKEIKVLRDSLKYYKEKMDMLNAMIQVYREEESLLMANKSIGGKEAGFQVSELKAAADFMRARLTEIKKNSLQVGIDLEKFRARYERINNQLNSRQSKQNKHVGEIVVLVSASNNVRGKLEMSYIYPHAGWQAVYDMRSNSVNEAFDLNLKANVFQNSGEDWNDIKLTVSSGEPYSSGRLTKLDPWWLSFVQPPQPSPVNRSMAPMGEAVGYDENESYSTQAASESIADYTVVSEAQTSVLYEISVPVSVAGDNSKQLIAIQNYKVPAKYEYFVVPKIDKDAFLVAKISGWEEYVLLAGSANLFFEGTFVGKSYIDPATTSDTLQVSLGVDKSISIERERKKDFTSTTFLGNKKVENVGWEINVRNNKRQSIVINVSDQIPVSTHKDISVKAENTGNADYEEDTGILKWRFDMKASGSKKLEFAYSVKYPEDKKIHLE